jgi:hypothetical protein
MLLFLEEGEKVAQSRAIQQANAVGKLFERDGN